MQSERNYIDSDVPPTAETLRAAPTPIADPVTVWVVAIDPGDYPRVGAMDHAAALPLSDKEVVLTFDDGPVPRYSNQILDILTAQCVKATFFLVGEMARAHPSTVRRIFAEGHTIGTHSEDHPLSFGKLPSSLVEWEIDKGSLDVGIALGDPKQVAPFFRVPGLARSDVIESGFRCGSKRPTLAEIRASRAGTMASAYFAFFNPFERPEPGGRGLGG